MSTLFFWLVATAMCIMNSEQQEPSGGKSVQDLIDSVFGMNGNTSDKSNVNLQPHPATTPSPGETVTGANGCVCVPYYLCNNGTVNKDGTGIIDIRFKPDQPCSSYLEQCCDTGATTDRPITPTPLSRTGCGQRNPDGIGFRITGDKDNEAQFGEFPWMVAILRVDPIDDKDQKLIIYQCGGSLIHPQVVLTAAHCVSDKQTVFKVRAGEWDTQTSKELYPHQDRNVASVTIHPQFYKGALYNDVAILVLDSPFDLNENVDVVCLPNQNSLIDSNKCYASGWGKDVFGQEGRYQVILKKIELPMVDSGTCQSQLRTTRLGKFFELHRSFVCAGGVAGKDTCKGDGGSPLVCPIPGKTNRYQQAGIVAWGIGCGENNIPGVYANVALFRDWIDEQMAYNNLDMKQYQY